MALGPDSLHPPLPQWSLADLPSLGQALVLITFRLQDPLQALLVMVGVGPKKRKGGTRPGKAWSWPGREQVISPRSRWEDKFCVYLYTHLSLVGLRALPLLTSVPWDECRAPKGPGENNDLHFLNA